MNTSFGRELALTLNWNSAGARLVDHVARGLAADITQAYLGDEIAAVFITHDSEHSYDLLNEAALYAYHSSADWGIVSNTNDVIVFNSHWVRQGYWYNLPPIRVADIGQQSKDAGSPERRVLSSLTPEGIIKGHILDATKECPDPEHILMPVDDALVDSLDNWRRESLRFTKSVDDFDENLQILFAQLFVLRAVEDRNLNASLPSLQSTFIEGKRVDVDKVKRIFALAQDEIMSDLFSQSVLDDIPDFVLGGIVSDLYRPAHLPGNNARYNFAWIDADVLGRAYQKYLSTLLVPSIIESQLQLFNQPLREAKLVSVQKKSGVYYTPSYLVHYLTERCLDEQNSTSVQAAPDGHVGVSVSLPRVADVSCGSGSFLTTAVDSLIRRLLLSDPSRRWGRELVENKCIIGIDTDPRAVTLARLSLWLRLAEEPDPLPLPSLNDVIVCGDSLREETWRDLPDGYDVIVGNPPFIATGEVENREALALRYETAQGRFDYSYLFVELAIKRLRPGGVLGLVVPNRLFKNRDAGILREMLTSRCQLLGVVDFTSTPVFAKVGAYVGALRARKLDGTEDPSDSLRYIKVATLPRRFVSATLLEVEQPHTTVSRSDLLAFDVQQPNGSMPWLFLSPAARIAHLNLDNQELRLSSLALVRQGIKTGANDIFLVRRLEVSDTLTQVLNGFNDTVLVETELLRPVVTGSDIQRYDLLRDGDMAVIYPYSASGLIPEAVLRESYPYTFRYLSNHREALAGRSRISPEGKSWYELSEKRDQEWLNSPKLLIRDLAQRISFALDDTGSYYCVGGTAVVPEDTDLLPALLVYLNSGLVNWYLSFRASTFRSNFVKFEPRHLNDIPILPEVLEDGSTRDMLEASCKIILNANASGDQARQEQLENEVDNVLCQLIGISSAELQ